MLSLYGPSNSELTDDQSVKQLTTTIGAREIH